jgi:hypothetical protein
VRRLVGTAVLLLLLTACGPGVVDAAAPGAPPYDGPLFVEVTAPPSDEDADRSGAAGRVVDCDHGPIGASAADPYDGGEVQPSAEAALTHDVADAPRGATDGFRVSRTEPDRVLYTREIDGRVRLAYVVRHGPAVDGHTGWYVESWARCDWAEFPPATAAALGLQVWTDAAGHRVPTSRIVSEAGPEHCDWQAMTFLALDGGSLDGGSSYVAHPDPTYYPDYFAVPYAEGRPLPAGAVDTGYRLGDRRLWLAADRSRAYVGTAAAVDVWPAEVQPLGCA